MNVFEFTDYRKYLEMELEKRVKSNSSYSLRNFATEIGVSPSHLSRVLNRKKQLSVQAGLKVSSKLGLNNTQKNHFNDLIYVELEKDQIEKDKLTENIIETVSRTSKKVLTSETFKVIADWYHFAILSLLKLKNFKATAPWISRELGISQLEAKIAIKRLKELGLLQTENGKLIEGSDVDVSTTDDISSAAIKKNHKENIVKAIQALETQELASREFNNCSLSVKMKDIPKVKNKIQNFLDEINNEFDLKGGDELYQLNIQFFRLGRKKEEQI